MELIDKLIVAYDNEVRSAKFVIPFTGDELQKEVLKTYELILSALKEKKERDSK